MYDNIKSNYILNKVFENIKNKRKLNIIKYYQRITHRLKITKEDFEVYLMLKKFNKKYFSNIEDIDIKELDLNAESLRNEGLEDLSKIKFKLLNKLYLSVNRIKFK